MSRFVEMYARLGLGRKKEPVNVAVNGVPPLMFKEDIIDRVMEAFEKAGVSMAQMGVSFEDARVAFEDARVAVARASFDEPLYCGVLRDDGSHGFGELRGFRSRYRRCSNPILERGWIRVGFSGPWLQEFGGVS